MKLFSRTFVVFFLLTTALFGQTTKIKFASLAPEGSTWLNVMKEYDQAIQKETGGAVSFKMYAGGIMGDEKTVLRKIRLGQLHSAGFTGVGLGEILPEVRILDSPFLFKTYDEVDFITHKFHDQFAKGFEEKGYILLGWAEVGFVYVFTNTPIQKKEDMSRVKMWMWESDPVARATFEALQIKANPLSVIEVMTALQTGMIDGVYASPLAILGLQWFTKVKYMMKLPLAMAAGAVLVDKKQFQQLTPAQQEILMKNGKVCFDKLQRLSREENEKSILTLQKNGVEIIPVPQGKDLDTLYEAGKKARHLLAGQLFTESLLLEVETALANFQNQKK